MTTPKTEDGGSAELKPRYPGCVDFLFAKYRVQNPPLKTLDAIILEARDKHDDILTEDSWSLDYSIDVSLTVRELRVLNEFIESLHRVYDIPAAMIAIAEFCGWTWNEQTMWTPKGDTYARRWQPTEKDHLLEKLPNYLEDLNAVHEAEKVLIERGLMCDYFYKLSKFTRWEFHATAAQRCEALLRTIGKWKEPRCSGLACDAD